MPRDGAGHFLRMSGETGRIRFRTPTAQVFACGILTTLRFGTTEAPVTTSLESPSLALLIIL